MKIHHLLALNEDVSNDQVINRFLDASFNLPHATDQDQHYNVAHVTANALLNRFPNVRYTGRMFRAIELDGATALKFKTQKELMQHIQTVAAARANSISSWSETLKGCIEYLNQTRPGFDIRGYSDPYAVRKRLSKDSIRVIVVYEQQGTGVSYEALRDLVSSKQVSSQHRGMLNMTSSVGEVLAPHQPNARLGVLILEGLGDKRKEGRWNWPNGSGTHWAKRHMFKPSDYSLYYQALEANTKGAKVKSLHDRIKPIHNSSQYNKNATDELSTETSWERAQDSNEEEYGIRTPRFSG